MTSDEMREKLADLYPGMSWRLKCQTMPERQVVAIFKSLEKRGKFLKKPEKKKRDPATEPIQITIYDIDPSLFFEVYKKG